MKQYQPKLNKEKTICEHIKTEIGRKGQYQLHVNFMSSANSYKGSKMKLPSK